VSKHATGDEVNVQVAGVVRQSDLVDDRTHVVVDDVAAPDRVRQALVIGHLLVARRERGVEYVTYGDGQSGGDQVEGDGEQHERRGRRAG